MSRCYLEDGASKGAWLNRSSIIFAGGDKWSVDPRVSISTLNKRDYSLQIQNVDVTDDGPYTCSVQTQHTPRTMQVHLTVQGECFLESSLGGISLKWNTEIVKHPSSRRATLWNFCVNYLTWVLSWLRSSYQYSRMCCHYPVNYLLGSIKG